MTEGEFEQHIRDKHKNKSEKNRQAAMAKERAKRAKRQQQQQPQQRQQGQQTGGRWRHKGAGAKAKKKAAREAKYKKGG